MGYKILVALFIPVLVCGCAAFDSDSTPFEGFDASQVPQIQGLSGGPLSGSYAGDMTLDSNTCTSVSDTTGAKSSLTLTVSQSNSALGFTFDDGTTTSGTLDGEKVTLMKTTLGVKHVYYLKISKGKIDGSCEVIEANSDGQYSSPCASYTLALSKKSS